MSQVPKNEASGSLHIRSYRPSDQVALAKIFREGIYGASGSPGMNALRNQWTWKTSLFAYTLGALGAALLFNRPMKLAGFCLIVSSFTWMVYHRITLPWSFQGYANEALEKDLKNDILLRHYRLKPVPNSQDYRPAGLPLFLVATVEGELVGFVGFDVGDRTQLDESEDYPSSVEPRSGEIRHMSVSGRFRRRGIARALVEAVIEHAESHRDELDYILLSTTEYQPAAIKLYERMGFTLDKAVPFGSLQLEVYFFRYMLETNS
ncbi:acyl-CoA N-acyltransferase [Flagelloscypha sp. PMI_526]|nr:acyl-CoA N-acyltransferase [Flagelloscypha sp. PMI_526]